MIDMVGYEGLTMDADNNVMASCLQYVGLKEKLTVLFCDILLQPNFKSIYLEATYL